MVERLWNDADLGKDLEYQKLLAEVVEIESRLRSSLDMQGENLFDHLTDVYARREKIATHYAFTEGFYIATEIYLELHQKNKDRPA